MKKKLLTVLALFSALAMIAGFSACADEPGGQEKEPQDISDSLVFTKNAEGTAYAVADLSDM